MRLGQVAPSAEMALDRSGKDATATIGQARRLGNPYEYSSIEKKIKMERGKASKCL